MRTSAARAISRRALLKIGAGCLLAGILPPNVRSAEPPAAGEPVLIGLDAEFGLADSTSAQAIERGMRVAIDEVNRAGGVLGGRPLVLVTTDNHSTPARAVANVQMLAATPELVAVFGGRFSPAVLECVPVAHAHRLPLLLPWSAADRITDNPLKPNCAFRLSLRDEWVVPALFRQARARGCTDVGLLAPNTLWGRSSFAAAEAYARQQPLPRLVDTAWFNWGDASMIERYLDLQRAGAQAIVFIANDAEAVILVNQLAALATDSLLPIFSHWGVTGGRFVQLVGANLARLDFSVAQSFSFFTARPEKVQPVLAALRRTDGIERVEDIDAPVGVAHAYDLTHILARAVNLAGSTGRDAVREALEQVHDYDGLTKRFPRPFAPGRHEALAADDVLFARYAPDGSLRPEHSRS